MSFHSPIVMDQGILLDRTWRIYSGQVPYRDFFCITPPLTYMTQALVFKLFSPAVLWMKVSLAVQMGLLTLVAGLLLSRIFQVKARFLWLLLPLTIAWLPATTLMFPWYDVDSVFWGYIALFFLGEAFVEGEKAWAVILAGICAGLSFLSKQNVGAASWIGGGIFILLLSLPPKRKLKYLLFFFLGAGLSTGAMGVYLHMNGALPQALNWIFVRSTDRLGGQSTVALTLESLRRIAVGGTNHFVKLLLVVYACALWSAFKDRDEAPPSGRLRLSALAYAAVILGFSMLQDGGFRYPDFQVYLPLFMAVLLLGVRSLRDQTPIKKPLLAALLSLCAAMTVWSGVIRWRQAPITQLCFTPDNPRLKGMYLRDEDHGFVQGLLEFEKSIPKTEGIFVFPDPLFFYFATERMSPVPAVPFLKFSWDLRPEERALIPRWLEDKKVEWAVIGQETSYDSGYLRFGREETWKEAVKKGLVMGTRGDYPDLERYLDRNFKEVTGPKGFWTLKRRR